MSFLLDTNILSHHMRGAPRLTHRLIQHSGRLAMPAVVLAELYAGAYLKRDPLHLLTQIADLLSFIDVIAFDGTAPGRSAVYGATSMDGPSSSPQSTS